MRKVILLFVSFCCSLFVYAQQNALSKNKRPNIIVFLVDDMGWMDTSVPFADSTYPLNKRYKTPNMERMAREGMKFTNAYATPVCTPSRTSLVTGMNAAHHGVTNWTSPYKNNNTDSPDEQFLPADWNYQGLSNVAGYEKTVSATTFPQLLKENGYFTIHVGKGHWGPSGMPGANPYNLGFMVNIAGNSTGQPQSYQGYENYGNIPGKATIHAVQDLQQYYGSETFLTEALTIEALKALDAPVRNKQPFYLNMAHYAVHAPLMADKRFVQKYLDQGLDTMGAYFASMVEGMDKSLGDIMDYLKKKGIENNTVILFMSDNGSLSLYPRGGKPHTQNYPLRAGKGSVYEGGIREPMIVKWPGVVKPASVANQYVIIEDFFPTILEMAGIKNYKTIQQVDGKSFLPVLKNPLYKDTARSLVWHIPNKWVSKDDQGINYRSAIRKGDWKLVYNMRDGSKELYNLKNDIRELNNLASQYPAKVKELASLLSEQLRKWKSPMPLIKSSGKPVDFPDQNF